MNPPVTLIYEGTVRTFNLAAGASFIVAGGIPIKTTFRIPLKERLSISEGLTEILPSSDGSYQLYGGRTYDVVVIEPDPSSAPNAPSSQPPLSQPTASSQSSQSGNPSSSQSQPVARILHPAFLSAYGGEASGSGLLGKTVCGTRIEPQHMGVMTQQMGVMSTPGKRKPPMPETPGPTNLVIHVTEMKADPSGKPKPVVDQFRAITASNSSSTEVCSRIREAFNLTNLPAMFYTYIYLSYNLVSTIE
mmetsp:Transcript_23377/g.39222  ORF Transcript_23377/g.39222 Transcript_23377/m.39222 type:complete len:247 (-) Transcript_23377:199-939(-)|eukprot:CAMPEP_0184340746 /NCGR_PEP_ID=MMETSP1089-20130417/9400_1 /TAXON_ID=38269 ORGANISM="Gloeochaete wittrockiana, Strain SAG46.84" /NCGR_SAMPLE_ID=MMETSP1089 /ASSEMBLY_ACC=CAM_ASM_000445 /LENGTH=246 /DNA_ID=CAMNT_0026668691 /DNA_START=142 /DNA_END=882 /DNA_ORIENTATION=-